ncbi:MAG: DUF4276 family protein [Candidatus Thiodiazotropha sp. (ex Epidulcina cf. delphinae)]|nr:DUF4276 family protein [Candidatus Thiodiazotropha sp. (ex Epidulcina cf. delphinae)]
MEICNTARRTDVKVCIACYELEAWYFGDLPAVEKAYPKFNAANYQNKAKYRIPDNIQKPSSELQRLIDKFQKGSASRVVPIHMDIDANRSAGFNYFIRGVRALTGHK